MRVRSLAVSLSLSFALVLLAGCLKSEKEEAISNGAKLLNADELKKTFSGNTFSGRIVANGMNTGFNVFMNDDGRIAGTAMGDHDLGKWRIAGNTLCIQWNRWQDKKDTCAEYYENGEEVATFVEQGGKASTGKVLAGNPKKIELRTDKEIAESKGSITPLAAAEAKAELTGNTMSGELAALSNAPYHAYYDASGKIAAKVSGIVSDDDKGVWSIKDSGEVCIKWSKWNQGTESCGPLYRSGKKLESFTPEGALAVVGSTRKGNPENLAP